MEQNEVKNTEMQRRKKGNGERKRGTERNRDDMLDTR